MTLDFASENRFVPDDGLGNDGGALKTKLRAGSYTTRSGNRAKPPHTPPLVSYLRPQIQTNGDRNSILGPRARPVSARRNSPRSRAAPDRFRVVYRVRGRRGDWIKRRQNMPPAKNTYAQEQGENTR